MSTDKLKDDALPAIDTEGPVRWAATADEPLTKGDSLGHPDDDVEYDRSPIAGGWRRDDWYGEPDAGTSADDHHRNGPAWSTRTQRKEKAAFVAHSLLRGVAPALCAVSVADPGKAPTELTDPQYYPHGDGHRQHLRQVRANKRDGTLTGGESTAVIWDGTPTEEFLSLVETWLTHCQQQGVVDATLADDLYRDSQRMKASADKSDEQIVALLVLDVMKGERSTPD